MNLNLQKIVNSGDGSQTIYLPEMDEYYHSVHGAITESKTIFIAAGFNFLKKKKVNILEIGFGTGLNAFLTLQAAKQSGRKVNYFAIEKYPVKFDVIKQLNYPDIISKLNYKELFYRLHQLDWNRQQNVEEDFRLIKYRADLQEWCPDTNYDLVYFDAFAPDKQPELWTLDIFEKICNKMVPGGVITTYTSKGAIRRMWMELGLTVEKLPGPPGKREFLRGIKK